VAKANFITIGYPEQNLNISLAANVSYNTVAEDKNTTLGPTLSIGKQFFDKQLRTNFSSSYNTSFANGEQQSDVLNFRLSSSYLLYEKHNLNVNFLMLFRNSALNTNRDLTLTFGYSYAFDNFKLNLKKRKRIPTSREKTVRFRYRNVTYSGTLSEVSNQLSNVFESAQFADIPQFKKEDLTMLLKITKEQKREDRYKENALIFLAELYEYGDFHEVYNNALFTAIKRIKNDMRKIDRILENSFVQSKVKIDNHRISKDPEGENYTDTEWTVYKNLIREHEDRQLKLIGHRWMADRFANYTTLEDISEPKNHLKEFKESLANKAYKLYDKTESFSKLERFLEKEIIDYYYKKSLNIANPDNFELRYINKN